MAVVHRTTLTPTKLELLASWLPAQPWYLGGGSGPRLSRAGGFRLDDPEGEVGIEFMAVTDESGDRPVTYHVPLSYRGAPLEGADHALVGTSEHGVLGRRWVYDGAHDPVLVAQLFALLLGEAEPQHQRNSNTPDPSVAGYVTGSRGPATTVGSTAVTDGPHGTELRVRTSPAAGGPGELTLHVQRVLRPRQTAPDTPAAGTLGHVIADWLLPDGTAARGPYVVVRAA